MDVLIQCSLDCICSASLKVRICLCMCSLLSVIMYQFTHRGHAVCTVQYVIRLTVPTCEGVNLGQEQPLSVTQGLSGSETKASPKRTMYTCSSWTQLNSITLHRICMQPLVVMWDGTTSQPQVLGWVSLQVCHLSPYLGDFRSFWHYVKIHFLYFNNQKQIWKNDLKFMMMLLTYNK